MFDTGNISFGLLLTVRRNEIMTNRNKIKCVLLSFGYLFLLKLYLENDLNRHLLGIISDSFWLTGVSVLYLIFLLKIMGTKLNQSYFQIRRFEYSSKIYAITGVKLFKRILLKYPFPNATRRINLKGKSESDIKRLENQMKEAEEVHAFGFVLNIILAVLFSILKDIRFLYWFTIFNILMNLYPLFLQRYNRNRIRILLENYYSSIGQDIHPG